ncbi:uncharacterized protein LOC120075089 [Benincasa hispida]|uniref:uncharacterized protein LOC120075089 n=1 Tax=Benincasa hispida TaxID=102211 RepID=UPI0018FFF760|nr:uncharacterized protein LOC120075089 [Benincasa hispida]
MAKAGAKKDEEATAVSIDTERESRKDREEANQGWIERDVDFVMVIVTFIATVAFQAGTNPPGGVWQEDKKVNGTDYIAGKSIMGTKSPSEYIKFMVGVTVCLAFSVIQLIVMLFNWYLKSWSIRRAILYMLMLLTITPMVVAFWSSLLALTPADLMTEIKAGFWSVIGVSLIVLPFVLLYYLTKKCL